MTTSTESATTAPDARPVRGGLREISALAYPVVLTQMSATAMGVAVGVGVPLGVPVGAMTAEEGTHNWVLPFRTFSASSPPK